RDWSSDVCSSDLFHKFGEVITAAKKTDINSRPTNAGLSLFLPKPPHTIFPKRIAQNDPNAATYHGVKGERVHSNNKAVTKAEPSKKLRLLFKKRSEERRVGQERRL